MTRRYQTGGSAAETTGQRALLARAKGMLLGGVIAATAVFGGTLSASAEKVVFAAGAPNALHDILIHLANSAGYFADEGLEPEIVYVNNGAGLTSAIIGGSADLATQGVTQVLRANSKGGDIVAVSRAFDIVPFTIVVSTEAIAKNGIEDSMTLDEKIARLKGLSIAVTSPGSTIDGILRGLLKNRGIDPDASLTIPAMNGPAMYGALENKLVDGFVYGSPWVEMVEKNGLGKAIYDPFANDVPEFSGVIYKVICTSRQTLKNKPHVVEGTVRALIKADKLMQSDLPKAMELLRPTYSDWDQAEFEMLISKYSQGVPKDMAITQDTVTKALAYMNLTESTPIGDVPFDAAVDASVVDGILKAMN